MLLNSNWLVCMIWTDRTLPSRVGIWDPSYSQPWWNRWWPPLPHSPQKYQGVEGPGWWKNYSCSQAALCEIFVCPCLISSVSPHLLISPCSEACGPRAKMIETTGSVSQETLDHEREMLEEYYHDNDTEEEIWWSDELDKPSFFPISIASDDVLVLELNVFGFLPWLSVCVTMNGEGYWGYIWVHYYNR